MIKGYVEVIRPLEVRGWAYDSYHPLQRVSIEVFVDGQAIGGDIADRYRSDLIELEKHGDAHYGFVINLERKIPAPEQLRVKACVMLANGEAEALPWLARILIEGFDSASAEPPADFLVAEGEVIPVARSESAEEPPGSEESSTPSPLLAGNPEDLTQSAVLLDDSELIHPSLELLATEHANAINAELSEQSASESLSSFSHSDGVLEYLAGGEKSSVQWRGPQTHEPLIPSKTTDPLQVFIVGPARSGTSIMFLAMQQVFGLPGFGEGHVMPVLQRLFYGMSTHVEAMRRTNEDILVKYLQPKDLEESVASYIRKFYRTVHQSESWVDKTPSDEAVWGIATIEKVFPRARIIVTKRSGIEVVQSYRKKFSSSFGEACENWASAMRGILEARVSSRRSLEVDQFDLTNRPNETAKAIAEHLGRADLASGLSQFFKHERFDQLSSHDWTRYLTFEDLNWSAEERNVFLASCGALMQEMSFPIYKSDHYC